MPSSQHHEVYTDVAFSNQTLLLVSTIGFASLGLVLFLILRRLSTNVDDKNDHGHQENRDAYDEMLDHSNVATLNRAQRRARAKFRMKKASRLVAPGQQAGDGVGGNEAVAAQDGINNNDVAGAGGANNNLTRRERQQAAKAKEREDRKVYAKEAKLWREKKKNQLTHQSEKDGKLIDGHGDLDEIKPQEDELTVEEMYPKSADEKSDDPLYKYLFWESTVKVIKEKTITASSEEMISSTIDHCLQKRMTICEFIERLKQNGSVSIAALADQFSISIPQVLMELETLNQQFGIIGIVDAKNGSFVYVSLDMIQEAVQFGRDQGRVPCPDGI